MGRDWKLGTIASWRLEGSTIVLHLPQSVGDHRTIRRRNTTHSVITGTYITCTFYKKAEILQVPQQPSDAALTQDCALKCNCSQVGFQTVYPHPCPTTLQTCGWAGEGASGCWMSIWPCSGRDVTIVLAELTIMLLPFREEVTPCVRLAFSLCKGRKHHQKRLDIFWLIFPICYK